MCESITIDLNFTIFLLMSNLISSRGPPGRRSNHRVFVQGLPPTGSWQDLKDHMREAGDVCYADVSFFNTCVVNIFLYLIDWFKVQVDRYIGIVYVSNMKTAFSIFSSDVFVETRDVICNIFKQAPVSI